MLTYLDEPVLSDVLTFLEFSYILYNYYKFPQTFHNQLQFPPWVRRMSNNYLLKVSLEIRRLGRNRWKPIRFYSRLPLFVVPHLLLIILLSFLKNDSCPLAFVSRIYKFILKVSGFITRIYKLQCSCIIADILYLVYNVTCYWHAFLMLKWLDELTIWY